jgi:hypothetical protein
MLKKSKFETDYRDLYRNSEFNIEKLKLAYVIQEIKLWRMGCYELSKYVSDLPKTQLENVYADYVGEDYDALLAKDEMEIAQSTYEPTDETV